MNKYYLIRFICLLLVLWMSCSVLLACREEQLTPEQNQPSQGENEMEVISLNGQWSFYRDEAAPAGIIYNDGVIDQSAILIGGQEVTATLTVDRPEQMFYSKLQLTLNVNQSVASNKVVPTVYAKVGDGEYFATDLTDFLNDPDCTQLTVDVGLYYEDLVEGENTVTVKTNLYGGLITLSRVALCYYPVLMFEDRVTPISVPGVWETQMGADYTAYDGVGWYQTTFGMPGTKASSQWVLTFDAIDYYAEIWINDRFICSHENGYTPVVIDLAEYKDFLQWTDNRLTVRVTDQGTEKNAKFPIKQTLAGFYHDSVGINYAGIWGDVSLSNRGVVRVDDITVNTDIDKRIASIEASLKSLAPEANVTMKVSVLDGDTVLSSKEWNDVSVEKDVFRAIEATHEIKSAELWDISSPKLYTARVELYQDGALIDTKETTFGFTSIRTEESKIIFNNRAIKLNGILSWLGNWDQISPRFDEQVFTEQIRSLKAYGFNAIKFCLVVPPEYLLDICDREGIYVYIEYPVWNPVQTDDFYARAYSQMGRMIAMGKNHPSVLMSDFNCEMQTFDDTMLNFMNWCVSTGNRIDQNRLFADNSSTGRQNYEGENDFWTWHPYTNALGFADYAKSIVANRTSHGKKPLVFGEYADYPALADFEAVFAANGGKEPWNWSAVDDPFRADKYFASLGYSEAQIKQIIAYSQQNCVDMKMYYVQETKKADGVAAYFLTIVQDIGHSVAGFFDEMGNTKFTPEQTAFLRESVLLLDRNVYSFTAGAAATVTPAISHYDGTDIEDGTLSYAVLDESGATVGGGELADGLDIENGCYYIFDEAEIDVPEVDEATRYSLVLTLSADNSYEISSHWDMYIYPEDTAKDAFAGKTVMVSGSGAATLKKRYGSVTDWKNGSEPDLGIAFDRLTDAQLTYLKNGGRVLYFGTGSEAVMVEQGTFYSQYVMVHFPREDHEIVEALASKGYGGLQFLNLQTQYVITEDKDDPLAHSIIGKILLRDNVGDIGQSGSYMSEFTVGMGTLIQSTLNVSGDKILGNYLIDVAAEYLLQ